MRAEQWMMVGVGTLGAYAIYRLATAPRNQAPLPPASVLPTPGGAPLPMLPVPVGSTALVDANVLALRQGRAYGGRLESGGGAADVQARAASMGLSNLIVMLSPTEARGRVPDWALALPTNASRWFVGTWTGSTATIPRPPDLVAAWATLGR